MLLRWSLPLRYFLDSRIPSLRDRISWVFTYPLPVLLLSWVAAGNPPWVIWGLASFAIVGVYSLYEYGYLVNDAVTVRREVDPTLRLSPAQQDTVIQRLPVILTVRTLCGAIVVTSLAALSQTAGLALLRVVVTASAVLFLVYLTYLAYNRLRGRITIPLFLVLVSLRFGGPIIIAASSRVPLTLDLLAAVVLVYPVVNAFEFAGKSRFQLPLLQHIPPRVDAWRLGTYTVLTLFALGGTQLGWSQANVFLAGSLYFLVYRTLTFLLARLRPSFRPRLGTPR